MHIIDVKEAYKQTYTCRSPYGLLSSYYKGGGHNEDYERLGGKHLCDIMKGVGCLNNYIANMTFYAGSDSEEDTDIKSYILTADREITNEELLAVSREADMKLDAYGETSENDEFPFSYEVNGLNSDTLISAIAYLLNTDSRETDGFSGDISGIYELEQWQ